MKLLFRTDCHVSDRSPLSWKGDYQAEVWDLLTQVGHIAEEQAVEAVLDGGDYFHVKAATRNSHALVARTASLHAGYPCPVYHVEGNHDMAHNNLDTVDRQPIGVLYEAGVFKKLRDVTFGEGPECVRVVGFPYAPNRTLDELRQAHKKDGEHLVAIVHQLAAENPPTRVEEFFGEPVFRYRDLVYEGGPDAWCFPPQTPVLDALYRPIPIEDVQVGQHMAGSKSTVVEAVHPPRQVNEPLIHFEVEGLPPLVEGVTSEHPFWAAKVNRRCYPDKTASSAPCSSCTDKPFVEPTWCAAGSLVKGDYLGVPVPSVPTEARSYAGLSRLLGYYLAEGHLINNRKGAPVAGVGWSFHILEHALHLDVKTLVKRHFGLTVHEHAHPDNPNCIQLCAYGLNITAFFKEHGGRYSDQKEVSAWVWERPTIDRKELLLGWLLGDGHARSTKVEVAGATASRKLAFQLFFLALSVGWRPCFQVCPPKQHQNHPCHIVAFYGDSGCELASRMGIRPPERQKTRVSGFFHEGLYYARITEICDVAYKGPVHNFRTSSEQYVAGGLLVHNCFGHWHIDQGIVKVGGKTFVNLGALSRGALVKENLTRVPKVAILQTNFSGISAQEVPLRVPPASEVFDLEKKDRQEQRQEVIEEFARSLRQQQDLDTSASLEDNIGSLDVSQEVSSLILEYLERARARKK